MENIKKIDAEWQNFKSEIRALEWLYGAIAATAGAAIALATVGIFIGHYLSGVATPIIAIAVLIFTRHAIRSRIEKLADEYGAKCWLFGKAAEKEAQEFMRKAEAIERAKKTAKK